jgi:hypothetical protein
VPKLSEKQIPDPGGKPANLLSPKASYAWDALVRLAMARNPAFVPPRKPDIHPWPKAEDELVDPAPLGEAFGSQGDEPTLDAAAMGGAVPPDLEQIAVEQSWRRGAGRGVNVTIVDESFFTAHPAFPAAIQNSALAFGDHNSRAMAHGTNVVGIFARRHPAYGMGIVPCANFRLGTYHQRRKAQMLSFLSILVLAGQGSPPPDVLVLPVQADGLPLETNPDYSEAIRLIVGSGVHVIASAGNRATRLTKRHFPLPPPGSILVGAGDAHGNRCDISNYGERVVAFAQGYSVFTTSVDDTGRKPRPSATNHFGGTSAATAIVGAVVCAIQGVKRLAPEQLPSVLFEDGFLCQPKAKIGIRPNLKGIFDHLEANSTYTES